MKGSQQSLRCLCIYDAPPTNYTEEAMARNQWQECPIPGEPKVRKVSTTPRQKTRIVLRIALLRAFTRKVLPAVTLEDLQRFASGAQQP